MSLAVCDLLPVFAAKHNHEAVSDPQTTAWRHSAVESSLSGCGPRFLLGSGKCGHSCSFHACSGFSSEAPSLRPCTLTVTPRCIDAAAGCCRRCPRLWSWCWQSRAHIEVALLLHPTTNVSVCCQTRLFSFSSVFSQSSGSILRPARPFDHYLHLYRPSFICRIVRLASESHGPLFPFRATKTGRSISSWSSFSVVAHCHGTRDSSQRNRAMHWRRTHCASAESEQGL
jgi:hypothetical protein